MATDANEIDLEPWEERMDELNDGLLEAYAAGFSQAVETFDLDPDFDTDPAALKDNEKVQEAHFYYWDGRTKPLELWLEGGIADD